MFLILSTFFKTYKGVPAYTWLFETYIKYVIQRESIKRSRMLSWALLIWIKGSSGAQTTIRDEVPRLYYVRKPRRKLTKLNKTKQIKK